MSNNIEEKETLEEQSAEEVLVETDDRVKVTYNKRLGAAILDEVSKVIISIILLFIMEAILKLAGYYISEKISMAVIIYFIVSIFYTSILENMKDGRTIGKKVVNI